MVLHMAVDYTAFTVKALQDFLRARALSTVGRKAELVARLEESDSASTNNESTVNSPYPNSSLPPQRPNPISNNGNFNSPATQNFQQASQTFHSIPGFVHSAAIPSSQSSDQSQYVPSSQQQKPDYAMPPTPQYFPYGRYSTPMSQQPFGFPATQQFDCTPLSQQLAYDNPLPQFASKSTPSEDAWMEYSSRLPSIIQQQSSPLNRTQTLQQMTGNFNASPRIRQPLSETSNNYTQFAVKSEKKKPVHLPLAAGQYLGYYNFEAKYALHHESKYSHARNFHKARRSWLGQLGLDIIPFQNVWVEKFKKDEVEARWALEPPENRMRIEKKAIMLKYHLELDNIPLRVAPAHLVGL